MNDKYGEKILYPVRKKATDQKKHLVSKLQ